MNTERNPWLALSALIIGFFMIVLDMTIVAVANPVILEHLHADISQVIWVTSAYLLAFAVPLLVSGRLGDRFGPKNLYLVGLTVFTAASLWCGLSHTIGMLIAARAAQGLGAALLTPQTMAVITRIFPQDKRGAAMGVWGAAAAFANLVGPLLGGVLVDGLGWQWIFIVNVPVGLIAFVLAARFVPSLPTHKHKFDVPGVVLSGVGMFMLVFGVQEGHSRNWDAWIWTMIVSGLVVLAIFVVNQARNSGQPLLPLSLFRDRNFALADLAIASVGAAVAAMMVPFYFYLQGVQGLSPTRSALVAAPMAVVTLVCAPVLGKLGDRIHPRIVPTLGFGLFIISVGWFAMLMTPNSSIAEFLLVSAIFGVANAGVWAPLAATATHNLPLHQAGAGAGVYNAIRQVGSVLGSAAVGAVVASRLSAHGLGGGAAEGGSGPLVVPEPLRDAFSSALRESMYLPIMVLVIGLIASALLIRIPRGGDAAEKEASTSPSAAEPLPSTR
ncbi:MAG: transporter [Nocardia sp.]|uniref:DHA2 family efflux MFS transporter permease subunit n=1 Tax=Nocardia sp. TaxID=1821 RepID=UPI0026056366|nr:DHA2 family efflux MFS transporter permease subunit [Nocardia sp.]MCU1648046.1 transporter [Nocardia sp.]